MQYEKQITGYISSILSSRKSTDALATIFDKFIELCQKHYDKPATNMIELRNKRNKKERGDIFECFCVYYMKYVYFDDTSCNVWLLADIPDEIRERLNLQKNDCGIDIIAESNDKFYAVQAKYRKKNKYKMYSGLTWKQMSTFYGLVSKTGPYVKHIIITNANYARHIGRKTKKDQSICLKTLQKIKYQQWLKMIGTVGNFLQNQEMETDEEGYTKIVIKSHNISTYPHETEQEKIRRKRLEYFEKNNGKGK